MTTSNDTQLPPGWFWARLDNLVEVLDHKRVPVSAKERARRPGGVPYYGATGQVGWIDTPLFDEDLVLLGEDGVQYFDRNKPKAYCISGPAWVNNHAHVLRAYDGITFHRFICHYLNSFNYEGYANGTTRLKLTKSAMASIPVPLPSLAEQHRIVDALEDHLSRIDAGIQTLTAVQGRTSGLQAQLYHQAVVGAFSRPVRAWEKVDEDAIRRTSSCRAGKRWKPVKPVAIPGYTPPENWTMVSLGTLSYASGYGTSVKCDYGADGYPVLRIPNIQRGSIDLADIKNAIGPDLDLNKYLLEPGDLLFVRTNGSPSLIGRVGVVEESLPYAFASYLIRFRLALDFVEPRWIEVVTQSPLWRQTTQRYAASSAGQYNLNAEILGRLPVPLPPLEVQRGIIETLDCTSALAARLASACETGTARAKNLRRAVLRQAFAGKLVPQDPADEPAAVLLERIRAERAAAAASRPSRRRSSRSAGTRTAPPAPRTPITGIQQELPL